MDSKQLRILKTVFRPLVDAIRFGNAKKVRQILTDNESAIPLESPLGTWLYIASGNGRINVVRELIDMGVSIDVGMTNPIVSPLQKAAVTGQPEIVEILLSHNAKCDVSSQATNPLFSAIGGGSIETVELLLKHGIDPTIRYEADDGMDAMSHAIIQGQREIGRRIALWIVDGDVEKGDSIYEAALDYVEEKIGEPLESRA